MKLINFSLAAFVILCVGSAQAATFNSYYCPTTFQNVKVGDNMDDVRAACGNPTATNTQQQQTSTPTTVTQWVYTLGLFSIKGVTVDLPTLTIAFDSNQKVMQIDRSGAFVSAGYCAANGMVNIGDPASAVLLTCGRPSFISTREQAVTTANSITEWTYNNGPYKPQIIFDFQDGKLTQISSGALGK